MIRNALLLFALGGMSACTTTRTDDHSYHYNDHPPVNRITYNTTNVVRQPAEAARVTYVPRFQPPQRRRSLLEQDEEYLQYHQGTPQPTNSSYRFSAAQVQPGSMGPTGQPQPMYRLPEGIVPYSPMGTAIGSY